MSFHTQGDADKMSCFWSCIWPGPCLGLVIILGFQMISKPKCMYLTCSSDAKSLTSILYTFENAIFDEWLWWHMYYNSYIQQKLVTFFLIPYLHPTTKGSIKSHMFDKSMTKIVPDITLFHKPLISFNNKYKYIDLKWKLAALGFMCWREFW